jgi:hypothetical protein
LSTSSTSVSVGGKSLSALTERSVDCLDSSPAGKLSSALTESSVDCLDSSPAGTSSSALTESCKDTLDSSPMLLSFAGFRDPPGDGIFVDGTESWTSSLFGFSSKDATTGAATESVGFSYNGRSTTSGRVASSSPVLTTSSAPVLTTSSLPVLAASSSPVLTTGSFVVLPSGNPLSIEGSSLSASSEGSSWSASSFFFPPLWPRFFHFLATDFGAGFFGGDLAVAFGASFFAVDFVARCFGSDLGVAARCVGDDFGVAVGEFPAPPDLVVIGDMVS